MEKINFLAFLLSLTSFHHLLAAGQPGDKQNFIIHVLKPNDTDYLSDDHRVSHHLSFLPTTVLDSGEPRLIHSYSHAISGFAARLTPNEVKAIEAKEDFILAVPDKVVKLQTTYTPSFLGLNTNYGPWLDSMFGDGIIIAVIDSGIYPTHLSFADDNGTMPPPPPKWRGRCDFPKGVCNNKLIGAVAFQQGTNPSPLDDTGHGTHTSSTAAGGAVLNASVLGQAASVAMGVAPRAHLAIYKVFVNRTGQFSDIIAGIDRAISDGADVLSMSIGAGPGNMYDDSIITASFAAMRRGIFPSAAAGNSGPVGGSVLNDAPWILTVAAGTTDRRINVTLLLGDGKSLDGESGYQPNVSSMPFTAMVNPGGNGNCSKSTLAKAGVAGKIVICAFPNVIRKGTNVKNAGGVAMVVLGPKIWGILTSSNANVLPAVYLNYPNAASVLAYMSTSITSAKAALKFRGTQFGAPKSPSVAAFSSRGPSSYNGGILKPDVIGPGVNILAAWPYGVGPDPAAGPPNKNFNFLSGTSMSTPHLSGIAAIIKKLHPDWSTAAVKSAIMTTTYTNYDQGWQPIADQYPDDGPPATYFAMGAGHVDPLKAVEPGLVYDNEVDDYLGYLCGLGYTDAQVRAVVQMRVSCATVKSITAEQLNYPSIALKLKVGTKKSVTRTVTNVGEAESVYGLKYVAPAGVELAVTPSELEFSSGGEEELYSGVQYPCRRKAAEWRGGAGRTEVGEGRSDRQESHCRHLRIKFELHAV